MCLSESWKSIGEIPTSPRHQHDLVSPIWKVLHIQWHSEILGAPRVLSTLLMRHLSVLYSSITVSEMVIKISELFANSWSYIQHNPFTSTRYGLPWPLTLNHQNRFPQTGFFPQYDPGIHFLNPYTWFFR